MTDAPAAIPHRYPHPLLVDDEPAQHRRGHGPQTEGWGIAVSAATLWEMILKNRKGKLPLPETPLHQEIEAQGFRLLPITPIHLVALRWLDIPHEDPFDRLLIATAMAEKCVFLTRDGPILDFALPFVERA